MTDTPFSQNPWNSADIIRGYKPGFTPRVTQPFFEILLLLA